METPREIVIRYLQDCEAAERNFEDVLATFGKAGEQTPVQLMFQAASVQAKSQHERLESRLRALGATPSTLKSILAHVLGFTPTVAQLGHDPSEKNTQHLIICIAAASAEIGMYESLATVAKAAGDLETERLARELQTEEKADYEKSMESATSQCCLGLPDGCGPQRNRLVITSKKPQRPLQQRLGPVFPGLR